MVDQLVFTGTVEEGDGCRCNYDEPEGSVIIGGRDVVQEVLNWVPEDCKVQVSIQEKQYEGTAKGSLGWGYSEYTPMDSDELFIGSHDIIGIMLGHKDKEITVRFTRV